MLVYRIHRLLGEMIRPLRYIIVVVIFILRNLLVCGTIMLIRIQMYILR